MSYPKLSGEEITRRGKELYDKSIRSQVETAENIGKIISINRHLHKLIMRYLKPL